MKSIAIGIGSYGISVITTMADSDCFESVIAIDSDRHILDGLSIEQKIFVSKRLSACDAVERIKNKLKKLISDTDIVFVISNPIDLPSPYILPCIVDFIKSLGIAVIAQVIDPQGKYERTKKSQAKHVIELLLNSTATIRIPQKNIKQYREPNYGWYDAYIPQYSGRDNILEQVEFDSWYKQGSLQESVYSKDVLVGAFYLQRTIELLNADYACSSKEEILNVISIKGLIHISSAVARYKDISDKYFTEADSKQVLAEILRWRALFNDIIDTSAHGSEGLIFVLNVSERFSKEDTALFCYMLHSFSLENTHSAFTINVVKTDSKDISVKLLATGADDLEKEVT